ncbi:MAG: hypothetical protein U0K83_06000 [Bacteroidales bacterium]|jgi:ABC-type Fe3+ transport system permease subunit|nr:hypothetical protein [Bacteroidales bacterium]
MEQTFVYIIAGLCIFGVVTLLVKSIQKRNETAEDNDKQKVKLSRIGSIIFYLFMIMLAVFFLVMYIMWKNQ